MSLLYAAIRGLLRLGTGAFFREIEVHGAVPPDGPCVIVANHHNSMMDPFLIVAASERPICFMAKAPLFSTPVLGWLLRAGGCVPVHRKQDPGYDREKNVAVFEQAAKALARGPALAIFPEGQSHSDPHLAEFRHGASRIALEAETRQGGVRVQMVGLHFEGTRGFRGRALVQFAPPMELSGWRDRFAADARAATAALTDELHARMSEMVLSAEDQELAELSDLVRRMDVLQRGEPADLREAFERRRKVLAAYRRLRETRPDEVDALMDDLREYRRMLELHGVRDENVAGRFHLTPALAVLGGLPFMAAAMAGNLPPYAAAWAASRLAAGAPDRIAGMSLQASLVLFPLYWGWLAWMGWSLGGPGGLAAALVGAPVAGAIGLRWMGAWYRLWRSVCALWAPRASLRALRGRVLAQLEALA